MGVALAGAGTVLAIIGVVTWSGDNLDIADFTGEAAEGSKTLGIVLSLVVVAVGYALQVAFPRGPLAASGTVAATLGVPSLLFFLTFDLEDAFVGETPFSIDAVLLLSAVIWVASYIVGPGRGRPFPLGAALVVVWIYVIEKTEGIISLPFIVIGSFAGGGSAPDQPDFTTIGILSLLFAAGYYGAALVLDRSDREGLGTPFIAAGVVPLVVGVASLADEIEQVGVGILSIALGLALAAIGANGLRRFTTWLGAGGVVFGLLLLIDEAVGDSATGSGIAAIIVGAAVVFGAQLLAEVINEPDEIADTDGDDPYAPSGFEPPPPSPPTAPPTSTMTPF
jgi:hypothetical protein